MKKKKQKKVMMMMMSSDMRSVPDPKIISDFSARAAQSDISSPKVTLYQIQHCQWIQNFALVSLSSEGTTQKYVRVSHNIKMSSPR